MIGIIFGFGSETLEVRVMGNDVYFRTSQFMQFTTIDGLKLSKVGVIKEFPDLKGNDDWNKIAISRFKEKIKKMNNEKEAAEYLIEDLRKYGYKPLYMQKKGFRPQKLK